MTYIPDFMSVCQRAIKKATKKNLLLGKIITKKIDQIILNPHHYKPLRYDLAGQRRVHIMNNLVLKFTIDEKNKTVTFIFFGHHDQAYQR